MATSVGDIPQACYDEWLSTMSAGRGRHRPYDETVSRQEEDLVLAYESMMRAGATPALDYCGRNVYAITTTGRELTGFDDMSAEWFPA